MTSNKEAALTTLIPKEERINFLILLGLLLVASASFACVISTTSHYYNVPRSYFFIGISLFIGFSLTFFSIALVVDGIIKKNYRRLASAGCILLIAAQLIFIFGEFYFTIGLIVFSMLLVFPLLILAINARLCQLGSPQSANRRLSLSYCFIFPCFLALKGFFYLLEHHSELDLVLSAQILCAGLSLLTTFLWISSIKKKLWTNTPPEEEVIEKPNEHSSRSVMKHYMLHLTYLLLLFCGWFYMDEKEHGEYELLYQACLCLGILITGYASRKAQRSRILQDIAAFAVKINIVFIAVILFDLIPSESLSINMLMCIVASNAVCIPLCLAKCRQELLASPSPQNKGWVHLGLLLNFPVSFISAGFIYFILAGYPIVTLCAGIIYLLLLYRIRS